MFMNPNLIHGYCSYFTTSLLSYIDFYFAKSLYGPIVLAGLTQDVDTIRGDLDKPDGFLYRNTEHIYDTFVWLQNNYMTKHQPKNIRLITLYEVTDEAYTVYFEEG